MTFPALQGDPYCLFHHVCQQECLQQSIFDREFVQLLREQNIFRSKKWSASQWPCICAVNGNYKWDNRKLQIWPMHRHKQANIFSTLTRH